MAKKKKGKQEKKPVKMVQWTNKQRTERQN